MSVTILETLENAEFNLNQSFTVGIAKRQLHNAIILLEKGYGIYEEVDSLLTEFKNVENVPVKEREALTEHEHYEGLSLKDQPFIRIKKRNK